MPEEKKAALREQGNDRTGQTILDRRVDLTQVDPQIWIFVALLLVATLLRFWSLGERAMHHDEAIHAWFSWRFYTGEALYRYNPTYHGPFLYHITAFFYFLFGDSDFVARAPQALFGVLLVGMCYPLRRWLGKWGWLIVAGLLTLSPAFTYFSRFARHDAFVAVWTLGMVIALFRYIEKGHPRDLTLAAAALALSFTTKELTFINAFIFFSFLGLAYLLDRQRARFRMEGRVIAAVILGFTFLLALGMAVRGEEASLFQAILVATFLLSLGYLGLSFLWPRFFPKGSSPLQASVQALQQQPRPLFSALGVFGVLFGLLFTTLLTHPRGFLDGLVQGLEYWVGQQGERRGGQPWFYYLLLMPLYEPVALTAGLAGFGLALRRFRTVTAAGQPQPESSSPALWQLFHIFLAYWALFSLVLYSWAGEKMPWLVLHVALPLMLLAGLALDRFLDWVSWRSFWRSGDWVVGPLFLVLILALRGLTALAAGQVPHELAAQYMQLQIGVLVLIFLGLIGLLAWRIYRIDARHLGQSFATLGLLLLLLYTVRSAFLVNYTYGDIPVEMLVYTQTAPDIPLVVHQIERLSVDHTRTERTAQDPIGGHGLDIAIDTSNNAALDWPFNWYLRDFDRVGSLSTFNGLQGLPPDADILLVLASNDVVINPYLVTEYTGMRLKHRWWFPEFDTYKRWSLISPGEDEPYDTSLPWLEASTYSQEGWLHLWNYVTQRTLPHALGSQDFYLYVRNDLLPAGGAAAAEDPYLDELARRLAVESVGTPGGGLGQLSSPRGVAVGPNGNIYVADAGNHRIVRFDASRQPISWGSFCNLASAEGCFDPDGEGPLPLGAGQFNEPWGVAVDDAGRVYVADTWNHRIQVFDADGGFLGLWGDGTLVDAELDPAGRAGTEFGLYGPRALTVDDAGNVYVVDTGNERVLVYSIGEDETGGIQADFAYQWGTMGPNEGQFLEPVGIAIDASGRIYVADTLNGRIQVFAPGTDGIVSSQPATTWNVTGWDSASRENKPYISVSPGGQIYFVVPERHYVAGTDTAGNILTVWGGYGTDLSSLNMPIGIAVDAQGQVYVCDSGNGRVLVFTIP